MLKKSLKINFKNKLKIASGIFLSLLWSTGYAALPPAGVSCGTEKAMQEYYASNPKALIEAKNLEKLTVANNHVVCSTLLNRPKSALGITPQLVSNPKYVIPVVFHVYGSDFNGKVVDQAVIEDAVFKTNQDFQGLANDYNDIIPEFASIKDTLSIEFRLARIDPYGNTTTGVVFHPAACGAGNYSDGNVANDNWDNYKYMNVYIQHDFHCDGVTNRSGIAWYPDTGMSNAGIARVVYNGKYLGYNTSENFRSVLTHEFGHYLNLIHTFEGGCSSGNESRCSSTGDQICDTPQVDNSGLQGYNCMGQMTNWQNFMHYSNQYANFTINQVSRSTTALDRHSARTTLWTVANQKATGVYKGGSNTPPVAVANGPYSGSVNSSIQFSSSGSHDPDGQIVSYSWDFGDGSSSTQANPVHAYSRAGNYNVTLTVTDNGGASNSTTTTANVGSTQNTPPTANVNGPYSANVNVSVSFSSRGSVDPDGRIVSYSWDFGDGSSSAQADPVHAYTRAGTYTVVLTVTDDGGASGLSSTTATIQDSSTGVITANPNGPYSGTVGNSVSFSSAGSGSPDGGIVEQEWDFGDGNGSSTSANPRYTYEAAGIYEVVLLVVDAAGNEAEAITTATITEGGGNASPRASVNGPYSGAVDASISFSSAGSSDPDGTIVSYSWDFGDGTSSSQTNPSHRYRSGGTYGVTLTVTDNLGATGSSTTNATITGGTGSDLTNACNNSSPVDGGSLESGTPVCVRTASGGDFVYFYFRIDGDSRAVIRAGHGSGNVAVYHQYNGYPTPSQYDNVSDSSGNTESITVNSPATGWHYVTLGGGYSGLTLQVDIQ